MYRQIISGINIGKMTQKDVWITAKDMFGFGECFLFSKICIGNIGNKKNYLFLSFPIQIFENIRNKFFFFFIVSYTNL